MATDGPEELLVTIRPQMVAPAVPDCRPWLGPLLIVGMPVGLAFVVFSVLLLR